MDREFDPPTLRIDGVDVDRHWPAAAEARSDQFDALPGLRPSGWVNSHHLRVRPLSKVL
jgi:hypothetical protein